ncbi:MAG TPA: ATP-binding cassette domain-containing protein [Candidatus Cloacimonadota bacterium]|jgi:ABC-2 type transport system ATP-binding protein|nr:ATP-binding cassette domain-containing protein [Candidatus Cloacimonadales bacterium]HPY96349.1 ATP-binding cassette domain-containing protein [Candidatus Cloacimonadota bacterium]HQB40925.1 ATP-binding cassette domain-containing protein [Candidatus Cloacimonadota bacterium]
MIKIESLFKTYGSLEAVKGISFEVNEGEITGFLGPNGAGKSTTLKIIAGFNKATSGKVYVNNADIESAPEQIKEQIGYLSELNPLYSEMTIYEYLRFICQIRNIEGEEFKEKLKLVTLKCGLHGRLNQQISTLSKGFKQRVGLAQAIIHDPPILILDEPTNGLDPNQIVEIRSLIQELGKDKTIILSSHILQEIQAICDKIIIIHNGLIVADSPAKKLLNSYQNKQSIRIEFTKINITEEELTRQFPKMVIQEFSIKENSILLVCETTANKDTRIELSKYITNKGATIIGLKYQQKTLEDVFHNLTLGDIITQEVKGGDV